MVGMVGMNVDADVDVVRVASGPHLGAPLVVDKRGEPVTPAVYVSITHHEGLAVAAAHDAPVGIDLTRVEALDAAFNREAFCDGELASFCAYGAACVAVAFAAKEACAKLLGVGFALPLLGFSVRPDGARRGLLDVVHGAEGCPPGARRVHLRVHRFGGREINRGDRVLVVAASYTERP